MDLRACGVKGTGVGGKWSVSTEVVQLGQLSVRDVCEVAESSSPYSGRHLKYHCTTLIHMHVETVTNLDGVHLQHASDLWAQWHLKLVTAGPSGLTINLHSSSPHMIYSADKAITHVDGSCSTSSSRQHYSAGDQAGSLALWQTAMLVSS